MGEIHIKLFGDKCPKTVENFTVHAKNNYYNGIIFHRVIKSASSSSALLFFFPFSISCLCFSVFLSRDCVRPPLFFQVLHDSNG